MKRRLSALALSASALGRVDLPPPAPLARKQSDARKCRDDLVGAIDAAAAGNDDFSTVHGAQRAQQHPDPLGLVQGRYVHGDGFCVTRGQSPRGAGRRASWVRRPRWLTAPAGRGRASPD